MSALKGPNYGSTPLGLASLARPSSPQVETCGYSGKAPSGPWAP